MLNHERGDPARIRICLPPWQSVDAGERDLGVWHRVVGVACHKLKKMFKSQRVCLVCCWLKHGFVNNKLAINILFDDPTFWKMTNLVVVGCRCFSLYEKMANFIQPYRFKIRCIRTIHQFGSGLMALCTIFTILLTLWNSEQKNGLLIKLLYFHLILMKLGEVVVIHAYYNFNKFHQNRLKVLLIARFSVRNLKVSVELWKSYPLRLPPS